MKERQLMDERSVKDIIHEELPPDDRITALEFITFLQENHLCFIRDNGYWKDKIYYIVKHNDDNICFIAIHDPDDKKNRWTVWSDDMDAAILEESSIEKALQETAWKHVDFCGGGRSRTIFGKEFDNVCVCTFRFDNPDTEALQFMKEMVKIRMREIG